jgi:copper chaperone CopZ
MESTKSFEVIGMTCDHCRTSVIEEVGEVTGVERVEVDLASGALHIQGEAPVESVAAAVAEAGYRLAGEAR